MNAQSDAERLARMEAKLETLVEGMGTLSDAVTQLAVIEVKQQEDRTALARAFDQLDTLDGRVAKLEQEQPLHKLASSWVFLAVLGVLGLLGAAAVGTVLRGVGA